VLTLALATLRTRWTSFAGAFVALCLGTGIIAMMALALAAGVGTPHSGPQRFPLAQTVVVPADPNGDPAELPAGLSPAVVARAATAGPVVADRTFTVHILSPYSDNAAAPTVGHGWSVAAFTPYRLTTGHAPTTADEVVVGGGTADLVGQRIEVADPLGIGTYTVVGVTGQVWFENALFFTDAEAARLSPTVNALASSGSNAAVRAAVGSSVLVLSGADRVDADPDPTGGAEELTDERSMAGTTTGIAASVAIFIVIATFAFMVDQRRRELALFRLVGATPKQIRRMVLTEAALLGAAAALTGCALGANAARPLQTWMIDHGVAPRWFSIGLNPIALLIAFLVGLAAAMAGAGAVALRASRVRPVEALRDAAANTRAMTPLRWLLGVGMLLGAVIAGQVISSTGPVEAVNARKYGMVPLLYVGAFALLAPVLLGPLARLATWPLSRFGATALLVRQNTLNSRRRTAAIVAPVVVAVGLTAAMLCVEYAGSAAKLDQAQEQTHAAYAVVPQGTGTLSPQTLTALNALPQVEVVPHTSILIYIGTLDGQVVDTLTGQAVPPSALGTVFTPTVVQGSLEHLNDNFIVLDQKTVQEDDLTLGQQIFAWLPDGTRHELRIAAVIQTGIGSDATYMSSIDTAGIGPDQAWLLPRPGTSTAGIQTALAAALNGQPAKAIPTDTYFSTLQTKQHQQTQAAAIVVLGIAAGYALISVANTLVMAATGRRRELAAANLAGATRAQTLRMVGAEALLATLIGIILAAIATAATIATQRLSLKQLATDLPLSIPWPQIWAVAALCTATAITAAVVSADRVTRTRAVEVLTMRE